MEHCKEAEALQTPHESVVRNQQKTLIVIVLSLITMVVEIIAGNLTGSMSLLADGWHMGSHVAALFLTYIVYRLAQSRSFHSYFTFGSSKLYSLGGFASAISLSFIAIFMAYESVVRFIHPVNIEFNEALLVCVIGLLVNLLSAYILKDDHTHSHDHDHSHEHHDHHHDHSHDHNKESAIAHVLADALTSVAAIFALLMGKYFQLGWIDPLIGLVGSAVILRWSYQLIKKTGYELLDGKVQTGDTDKFTKILEAEGGTITDLHIWSVGAGRIAAIVSIETMNLKGAQFYHQKLESEFNFSHLVIEEIKKP